MANNPVQIVLNDEAFLRAPEPGRGGPDRDFFDGDDEKFRTHKSELIAQLDAIDAALATSPDGPLTYVRVRMRNEAIAKSYRPNRALLTGDLFPCVGAGAPGELFFRLPRAYIHRLRTRFEEAEVRSEQRRPRNDGKPYLYVTRFRSELGAIESLDLIAADLKRKFSAATAVSTLLSPSAASGYVVELFEDAPLQSVTSSDDVLGLRRSFQTLQDRLRSIGPGLYATLLPSAGGVQAIELALTTGPAPALIEDRRVVRHDLPLVLPVQPVDRNIERHEQMLTKLASHPLVRRIRPPILLEHSDSPASAGTGKFVVPIRPMTGTFPKVGVIDTGISRYLLDWTLHRHDFLDEGEVDVSHGTQVAGILIGARGANGQGVGVEEDGCDVFDIPMLSTRPFLDVYGPRGFEAFLEELEAAIVEVKERYGVRIFNMSLNLTSPVEQDLYSVYAARLDEMQDRLGVLIVNSAGNLDSVDWRPAWPKQPNQALAALANRTTADTIYMPCESVRALAVGALTPPGCKHIEGTPATYTRRGPGLRVGVKPDVAHFGGAGDTTNVDHTGLATCSVDGDLLHTRGTSFASPLAAKTAAALDVQTGEKLEPRTLRAFMIHNSRTPDALSSRRLTDVARQFVGFGQPTDARSMLETDDHAITLVFESRLTAGEARPAILRFPFVWPASLVDPDTRACRGIVRMTLVYDAPIDPAFGTEFVRVNLDAYLRQRQPTDRKDGKPSWRDQIRQCFLPKSSGLTVPERALIEHGLKWWPTKRYEEDFGGGVGQSTEWRLEVESVVRAEADFPAEGVPFSLILTIEDPDRDRPLFNEFRRQLVTNQVDLHDIRTAVRLRARGGRS
jgi:hypothetical protein